MTPADPDPVEPTIAVVLLGADSEVGEALAAEIEAEFAAVQEDLEAVNGVLSEVGA